MTGDALNMLAIVLALLAVFSGFRAVGRRSFWDFGPGFGPYLKGNSRALLYLLTATTTILSVAHVVLLLDWLLSPTTDALGSVRNAGRMIWHCLIAVGMIALHLWTRQHRLTRLGQPDRFFWGAGNGGT